MSLSQNSFALGLGNYKPEFRGFRRYEWFKAMVRNGKPYGNRLTFEHSGPDALTACPSPQKNPGKWNINIGRVPYRMDVSK